MKINNHIKISILFFVFCSPVFFSCHDFFQPPMPEKPAEGTGYLSLSIGGVLLGRTILPIKENNVFAGYGLKFIPIDNKGDPVTEYWNKDTTSGTISLHAGTYDVQVTAYMDDDYTKPAAEENDNITITPGENTSKTLMLKAIIKDGEGTFSWKITYPNGVTTAGMTITRFTEDGEKLFGESIVLTSNEEGTKKLPAGYYRVVIKLAKGEKTAELREILHIYPNMDSRFEYGFTDSHFTGAIFVTSGADAGNGSLRWAIGEAQKKPNSTIIIDSSVKTITLTSQLEIIKDTETFTNLTIEGNGVIITRSTAVDNSLIKVSNQCDTFFELTIRRVHFKGGKAPYGGAISNYIQEKGFLTLESCIFSENQAEIYGGAIDNNGQMEIKGCTFYGNSANNKGGAIYNQYSGLDLTGNLFYGNTAPNPPVVFVYATANSNGYNVIDVEYGNNNWGWTLHSSDKYAGPPNHPIVMQKTFKPISGKEAIGIINSLPDNYSAVDFYGYPITESAAAGAVQEPETGSVCIVTFDSMGGSSIGVSVVAVKSGDTIEEPNEPVWPGNKFIGWYESNEYQGNPWVFDKNQAPNAITFTLYAKWDAQAFWDDLNLPDDKLSTKLSWLSDNIQSSGNFTIIVTDDASITPSLLGFDYPVTITIKSDNAGSYTIRLSEQGSLFTINNNVTLKLENITLQGLHTNGTDGAENNSPLVYIASGGTLIMNNGSKITGNTNSNSDGGGVFVDSFGTFYISDGIVYGNDEDDDSLKNKAANGAALYAPDAANSTAKFGPSPYFPGSGTDLLSPGASEINTTIKVENGQRKNIP